MPKYKVYWEVSKHAFIEAENEEEAINKVLEDTDEILQYESEVVSDLEAIKIE
jgi:hypothetical protein